MRIFWFVVVLLIVILPMTMPAHSSVTSRTPVSISTDRVNFEL